MPFHYVCPGCLPTGLLEPAGNVEPSRPLRHDDSVDRLAQARMAGTLLMVHVDMLDRDPGPTPTRLSPVR